MGKTWLERHFKVYWLQAVYVFAHAGFGVLLYIVFFKEHITLSQLLLGEFLASTAVALYLTFRRALFSRFDMRLGFILYGLVLLLFFLPFSLPIFFTYFILRGIGIMTFYTPYNILFFNQSKRGRSLQDMTWYWGVGIAAGVIAPIFGGFVLGNFSFGVFLALGASVLFCGAWLSGKAKKEEYRYTVAQGLNHLRSLRTVVTIDGALHKVMMVVIPIYGLLYFSDELDYGMFLSLVAVVALLFSFRMAKLSDKLQKRRIFIWPLSIAAGIATGLFYFAESFWAFLALALILRALSVMVEPIRSNIIQDKKKKSHLNWISREIYLNIGRALMLGVVALMMYAGLQQEIFIFLASLHILFPIVVSLKKVYGTH